MDIMNKLKNYIINAKYQFAKFFIIGLSSAIIDLSLVIILKEVANLRPVLAVALSQIFVILYNFLLNKFWSFKASAKHFQQFSRFMVSVFFNYFAAIFLMYIFYDLVGLNYKLVRLGSIALMSTINFMVYKHWVYKES